MENHAYDTMLGYMDAPIGSLKEKVHCNTYNKKEYCQSPGADFSTSPDPAHSFPDVNIQLFESPVSPINPDKIPGMNGFALSYVMKSGNPQNVFDCYTPQQVPIISTLAENFMNYDNWFCSVPTQTDPNKFFVNAASSGGHLHNCPYWYCAQEWPVELDTIQTQMQEEGYTWSIHWQDWCEAMAISPLNQEKEKFVQDYNFVDLYKKMQDGTLEDYTYVVPRIYTDTIQDPETGETITLEPNTQHPSEDVRNGEQLLKEIYENLRKSKSWEDTLLLIAYDEHGGFYDHVVPPNNVSNPTPGENTEIFGWKRLGVRVPSIAISPWLKKYVNSTQLEHASIPKTIREIFNLKAGPLSIREEESNGFITDDMILDEMRTDCPMTLPEVPFGNDSLYKYKPENHIDEVQYNGTPKTQLSMLGTLLVKKGILNLLKLQQVGESIKSDSEAMQFVKEAQTILGYRTTQNLKFKYLNEQMKFIEQQQ